MQPGDGHRIAALDGIRACAITCVLSAHVMGLDTELQARLVHLLGNLGVRMFFVLSGFLITSLLVRELRLTGRISLRDFYARRSFRIFPALYTYLAVVGVLAAFGVIALPVGDAAAAATYTMNFHGHRVWEVGHLWSLAVEEQFYFLWPGVLLAVGIARARHVAIACVLAAPVVRLVMSRSPAMNVLADQAFPCVLDGLGIGCLLALYRDELEDSPRYRRFLESRWFWVPCTLAIASLAISRPFVEVGPAPVVANIAIAMALHRIVMVPGRVTRALETRPMVTVGVLSYSLYVWQQLFLNRHGSGWWNSFPLDIVLAVVMAGLSYVLVEQPFLRLSAARRRHARLVPARVAIRS